MPHLSYVGDADIGADANLGASTITANYDGVHKHRTKIGDGVHTSVHTSLVRRSSSATVRRPVPVRSSPTTSPPGMLVKGVPARVARPVREDDRRTSAEENNRWNSSRRSGSCSWPGRGHEELSSEVAEHLQVPLGEVVLSTFANGEIYCRYGENIRGARRVRVPVALRTDQRPLDGTAHHDRRGEARVGEAHHRGRARSTATRARTARPKAASRSPRGSSPTSHRGRRRPRRSPSTCTPARSRASSTTRSTTSPRCPCSRSTCGTRSTARAVFVAPDAGGGKLACRYADRLGADIAFIDKRRPEGHAQRRGRDRGGRRDRGPHLRDRRRHDRHRGHGRQRGQPADRPRRDARSTSRRPTACSRARPSTG